MLLPEDGLGRLLEQLDTLPAGDRRAILARLSPGERARIDAWRGRASTGDAPAASPYSADLARRIADAESGRETSMTSSAREALLRAAGTPRAGPEAATAPPSASLADAVGGMFRRARNRA